MVENVVKKLAEEREREREREKERQTSLIACLCSQLTFACLFQPFRCKVSSVQVS